MNRCEIEFKRMNGKHDCSFAEYEIINQHERCKHMGDSHRCINKKAQNKITFEEFFEKDQVYATPEELDALNKAFRASLKDMPTMGFYCDHGFLVGVGCPECTKSREV